MRHGRVDPTIIRLRKICPISKFLILYDWGFSTSDGVWSVCEC